MFTTLFGEVKKQAQEEDSINIYNLLYLKEKEKHTTNQIAAAKHHILQYS